MMALISLFDIISVLASDPKVFLWIPASKAAAANPDRGGRGGQGGGVRNLQLPEFLS